MVMYSILPKEVLEERVKGAAVDDESMNIPVYRDFYYFSPQDFAEHEIGTQFVIAVDGEEIIGVLKFKRYSTEEHEYVPEQDRDEVHNYLVIRYINTHKDWKRKGVARGLLKRFNEFLGSSDSVVDSPETGEGRQAGMHKLRKETLTYATSYDCLEDYQEDFYLDHPELI